MRVAPASRQMIFALLLFCFAASRTSFAILLVSAAIVVARRSKALGIGLIAVIAAVLVAFQGGVLDYLHGTEASSNFTTLSGRTIVWTAAIREWQQHPWLGLGGGVGGKIVLNHIGSYSFEILSSLHNGFMELLTGLGAIGVLLGVYLLSLVTWRTFRAWKLYPEHSGTYVLIIHVWACTIMSTGIFGWMGYEMAIFLCLVATLDLLRRTHTPANSPVPEGELVLVEN